MKRCGTCEVVKPLSEFNDKRTSDDGKTATCTVCLSKMKDRRNLSENKQASKEYSKTYRANNKEKLKDQKRQHYLENSDTYQEDEIQV